MQQRRRLSRASIDDAPVLGRKHKGDHYLIIICSVLLAAGLILLYAIGPALSSTSNVSSSYYTYRQLIAILISIVVFIATANTPLSFWKKYSKIILAGAILATLVAIILPVNPLYPAHRWIRIGALSFQSVEAVKFAVIIYMASFLALALKKGTIKSLKDTYKTFLGIGAILIVVAFIQSDFGSALVIGAIAGAMSYLAGIKLKYVFMTGAALLLLVVLLLPLFPYRMARIQAFLEPQAHCQTSGYQVCQALIAVGSGGFIGLGLGKSVQAYGYEPEASNDSVFSIFAETFGFVGSVLLLGLYMGLFYRLKKIVEYTTDDYSRFIIVGIMVWIASQAIINIGAMLGLMPLKGITLPFISYGGTSVIFVAGIIGVAYQISRYTNYQKVTPTQSRVNENEDSDSRRRIRRTYYSGSGSIR